MTAALDGLPVTLKTLCARLAERGLKITLLERHHIVAGWPARAARLPHDERRVVVLRQNERGDWRGVILVGAKGIPNGYDLVAQENRFRDLLHVSLWLGAHAPQQPSLANGTSPHMTSDTLLGFQTRG